MYSIQDMITTSNNSYKDVSTHDMETIKYIVIHSTGVIQKNPIVFAKRFNVPMPDGQEKSVHGFIGIINDYAALVNTLPHNMKAWHAGGPINNYSIGIELCETENKDEFIKIYNSAVDIVANLCISYNLKAFGNVVSHKEAHKIGLASNHSDCDSYLQRFGYTMYDFKKNVESRISEIKNSTNIPSEYAKKSWEKVINKKIMDGSNPKNPLTREQLAVVLDRLGLL